VIFAPQVNNHRNNSRWYFTGMVLRRRRFSAKPPLVKFIVLGIPSIEGGSHKTKVAAGHTDISNFFGVYVVKAYGTAIDIF
jgi:hypothetical protein